MIYCRFIAVLLFACALFAQASQPVQLLSERYRTEWNWVEYRISLKNTSDLPVLSPHIRYFAENPWIQYCGTNPDTAECRTFDRLNPPADTMLEVFVDYSSYLYSVTSEVSSAGTVSVVELYIDGLLYPNHIVDINFRIYRKDWGLWNPTHDWSYQRNAEVIEPNYFMAVYDASGNILWGSDPLRGNVNADDILWSERGSNFNVGKFSGDTSEILPAGRFWMLKDSPVSPKERDLLAARGIVKHSGGVHQGKTLAFFRSENVVKKSTLDSIVAGFYNAFPANDTTPVEIDLSAEDLYEERNVCDSNGVCHVELEPRTVFSVEVACWPDVSVDNCVETMHDCGGTDIGIARGFLVAKVGKDSLQCLGRSRDVDWLGVPQKFRPTSSMADRDAINISVLQNSVAWQEALAANRATEDWLSGVEYTGDGILVGVYDSLFDINHLDFNEYDSNGKPVLRTMRREEYLGVGYNPDIGYDYIMEHSQSNIGNHGTNVAGVLGGNGNTSENFEYRGIAPKVHFYVDRGIDGFIQNQIGHVVNHSHITQKDGLYYKENIADLAIFRNWTSGCTPGIGIPMPQTCVEGDTLVKTVVFAAANNGDRPQYGVQRGYHSILANTKNAIVVGNITSEEKVRSHNSSMGPTWDGRIKPDIMAPGATSQFLVDSLHPFQVQIDYVKMYRAGSTVPYFVLDFENSNLAVDDTNTSCANPTDRIVNIDGKDVFNCIYKQPGLSGITIGWKLPSGDAVRPSDSMEVMLRRVQGGNRVNVLYGNVDFGTDSVKFDTSFRSQPVVWNFADSFSVTRFGLRNLDSAANAYFLRLDFSFVRGIIVPDLCRSDTCDYAYQADGGTSMSAPFVSGIAALMYQKFRETTGDSLDRHSMRNSTVKALIIHTAIDMVDSPEAHFAGNPDLDNAHHDGGTHFTPYGEGPDFATGWGRVDGKAALDMISQYNRKTKLFAKFREIEIGNAMEKRWTVNIRDGREKFRATLVWDDYPGERDIPKNSVWIYANKPKLVNDLDMYLVSPSGKYYYPWRLDPLPTSFVDSVGNPVDTSMGYENIHEGDVRDAYNGCGSGDRLDSACFDHLNNVEVVDVNNPEPGTWQIVVVGKNVREFNNADSNAQVASLVSDLPLTTDSHCGVVHDYKPQTDYSCTYSLGENSVSYVTFDDRTFVGVGDTIRLLDENGAVLGTYTENRLAGRQLKLRSKRLTVNLHSNNDNSQGWGFAVTKIKTYPYSAMKMPFDVITRKRRNP